MAAPVSIGIARADITPPVGIPMVGFAGRGVSTAVHDPLLATVLVASTDDRTLVLVTNDLLQVRGETVCEYRAAIAATTGAAPADIAISCAHNHYGPDVDRSESPLVSTYREHVKHVLAGVASEAMSRRVPARIGLAWGSSDIGINRRERRPDGVIILGNNPDGPVDREVGLARIEDMDGKPIACLANFACHPVCQGGGQRELSADFVGSARGVFERIAGVPLLYVQGASGNINPIRMEPTYEPARSLGVRLGCEITRLWETAKTESIDGLDAASRTIDLPRYRYGSEEQARQLLDELDAQIARMEAQGGSEGSLWWAKLRRQRANDAVESWAGTRALEPVSAEMQALRIGSLTMATAPAEVFNENATLVKRESPTPGATFFSGYTNGSVGYIPTRPAYDEGGYEVTHACQVDPDAGDLMNEASLELLRQVAASV
ncbi:hypothetical protein FJZ36_05065 [Candidatus Poribacteria bacterium]|nr:hypothetical protein [Candidatus Poribacteria bacterium]